MMFAHRMSHKAGARWWMLTTARNLSHNRERRQSPQSARCALLRRRARQAKVRESKDSPLPIPCGPGASKIQHKSYGSSPCGAPCTVQNEPGRRTTYPKHSHDLDPRAARLLAPRHPRRTPEAGPQDCRHPEGETSRKTAGARDDPTRRTIHPHHHTI